MLFQGNQIETFSASQKIKKQGDAEVQTKFFENFEILTCFVFKLKIYKIWSMKIWYKTVTQD